MIKRLFITGLCIGCLMVSGGCSNNEGSEGTGQSNTPPAQTTPPVQTATPTQTTTPIESNKPGDKVENERDKVLAVEQKDIYEEYEGYTIKKMYTQMSSSQIVNIRSGPDETYERVELLANDEAVNVIGQCKETGWYMISYDGGIGFVSNDFLKQEVDNGNLVLGDECPHYLYTRTEYDGQVGWFYRADIGWQCENYEQVVQEIRDEGYSEEYFPIYVGTWRDVGDVMWMGFS